ncbi:MAG: hypothetical protein AB1710_10530 [Pseudomonadota bacterium]
MFKVIAAVAVSIALAGCATPYQKRGLTGGFSETQLAENVWRVSFIGNDHTSTTSAQDMALLRCAELTKEKGYKYFGLLGGETDKNVQLFSTPTTTTTTGYVSSSGLYTGTSNTYGGHMFFVSSPTTSNTIIMFREKPEAKGMVFDASFVCESIGPRFDVKCGANKQ